MKWMIKSLSITLLFSCLVLAQALDNTARKEKDGVAKDTRLLELPKTFGIADEAVGVLDKGQLQNITMNYGQITDTRFEDRGNAPTQSFFNFRYPRANWTSLTDDFSIIFALPDNTKNGNNGNVIDGYTENDNEDWIAKDGAFGETHYNPSVDPSPEAPLLYPPDNPVTPYLAHSDLPATWPSNAAGERFWPGYFRRDPATGESFEGEFASDRDVYATFTDAHNQFGNPIGIEVEMMAYSYGRPFADKFQFYEFFVHNKSGRRLDSCYVGYYSDPDCSDHGEETLLLTDPTFSDPNIPDAILDRDFDGDIGGATRPNNVGKVEDETFGLGILETPKDMGVTTFHYFQDVGPVDDKVLWPIIASRPGDKDVRNFAGAYFHGDDPNIDDVGTITTPQDLVFIVATGPFSMEPDEVVKSTIVVAVGDNDADCIAQIEQAIEMFNFGFIGPSAPPAPTLSAAGDDGQVTLYWDAVSEVTPDAFSGNIDFEGYRIYRSEDNGQTWGDEVRDAQGNLIGYIPIAQFDLDNNISGFDPRNPVSYLGDNTGLRHSYVDRDVRNGIRYSYTVVAYDRGDDLIFSLESARGTAITDRNFVTITPRPNYSGRIPAEVESLTHSLGNGKGEVTVNIVDDNILKEDTYTMVFNGDPATSFKLVNESTGDTLAHRIPLNVEDNPVIDGFQIAVTSDQKIGGIQMLTDGFGFDLSTGGADSSGSWVVSASEFLSSTLESRSHDYEIRFTDDGATAYSWGPSASSTAIFKVPFEVWDVTEGVNQQVAFEVQDNNADGQWGEGETIFVLKSPYTDPQLGDPLGATFPDDFAYQVIIANSAEDTEMLPPRSGDMVKLNSFRSLNSADRYSINFKLPEFDAGLVDLNEVRVVPNPYLVGAAWEELQNTHQIRFMYLPPVCTINIYTLNGERVNTIEHDDFTGDELFNLVNESNQALAFGVYVYVVTTPQGDKHMGKFAIIR